MLFALLACCSCRVVLLAAAMRISFRCKAGFVVVLVLVMFIGACAVAGVKLCMTDFLAVHNHL